MAVCQTALREMRAWRDRMFRRFDGRVGHYALLLLTGAGLFLVNLGAPSLCEHGTARRPSPGQRDDVLCVGPLRQPRRLVSRHDRVDAGALLGRVRPDGPDLVRAGGGRGWAGGAGQGACRDRAAGARYPSLPGLVAAVALAAGPPGAGGRAGVRGGGAAVVRPGGG